MEQKTCSSKPMMEATTGIHWGDPGKTGSAFDFRSDTVTTASTSTFEAIRQATLNDDVYGEDDTTAVFERQIAETCGKEAAIFVVSGTMANQLALRALLATAPPHGILADSRAHIVNFESGGLGLLSGAMLQAVAPANGRHLTMADVAKRAVPIDTAKLEKCPTTVVSIENTSHGSVVPLEELRAIHEWCRAHRVAVHVDGARLWNAVATGAGRLDEYAACCDALTLCFMKGIAAPIGAMVVGSAELVGRVRRLRQSIGGGVRQIGPMAAAARQAVCENFGTGSVDERGTLTRAHGLAARIGGSWTQRGGRLLYPVETNMVWLDLKGAGVTTAEFDALGSSLGIRLAGPRIVTHGSLCEDALRRLEKVFDQVFQRALGHVAAELWRPRL